MIPSPDILGWQDYSLWLVNSVICYGLNRISGLRRVTPGKRHGRFYPELLNK
jgi:hypothetical protein